MIAHGSSVAPTCDAAGRLATAVEERSIRARVVRHRAEECDVLVDRHDRHRFDALLESLGYVVIPTPVRRGRSADRDRRFHYHSGDGITVESMTVWAFDPAGGHSHRWIVPGLSEAILDGAPGGPGSGDEAPYHLASVLHEVINRNGRRTERLCGALMAAAAADPMAETARRFLDDGAAAAIVEARRQALAGKTVEVGPLKRRLVLSVRRASWTRPADHVERAIHGFVDRLVHRRLARRQVAVALLGPDGVGKTTVATLVAASEPPPRTRWTYRYNGRPKLSGPAVHARRLVKYALFVLERGADRSGRMSSRDLGLLAEIRLRRLEAAIGAWKLRLTGNHLVDVILFDRGTADEAAELSSPEARDRAKHLVSRRLPGSEDLVVLLSDDAQVIHARKDEKTPAEIETIYRRLRSTLAWLRNREGATELDVRKLDPASVAERLREAIVGHVATRAETTPLPFPVPEPRLVFFVLGFPGPDGPIRDGVHKAVDGIAGTLARQGRDVVILGQGAEDARYHRNGYEVRCFRGPRRFGLAPGLKAWLQDTGSREGRRRGNASSPGDQSIRDGGEVGPNPGSMLFVLNGGFNPAMFALSRRLVKTGQRYVHVTHQSYDDNMFEANRLRKRIWWSLFERRVLADAAAVQMLDARHGRQLRELGVESPWFSIPNGFRPEELDEPHGPLQPHDGPARLYFFGRLYASYKGLDLLIQAVAREPGVVLTLQGPDCGDNARLSALATGLGCSERVRILEPDYTTPPVALVGGHDLFCLPSRSEGFGLAALEAMLAERPVLISDVGGLAESVERSGCGVVVQPTVDSIHEGLRRLLAMPHRWAQMGSAGRVWAAEHLTWDVVAVDTWNRYRSLGHDGSHHPELESRP